MGTLHEDQHTVLSYLAQFFLEWDMFQTNIVEKIKTHILGSITDFSPENNAVNENVEKYRKAGQATDGNMAHAHSMLDN